MKLLTASVLFFSCLGFGLAAEQRTNTGARQVLSVEGVLCPEVTNWSGGEAKATVAVSPSGKKQVGAIAHSPIVVEASLPLSPALLECFAELCAGRSTAKTLLLSTADFNGQVTSTLQARNAQLVEVRFPELNGASKEVLRLTLIFNADNLSAAKAESTEIPKRKAVAQASNFRLTVEGLPTDRVASVNAFTIKRYSGENGSGQEHNKSASSATNIPDLALHISAADAADWNAWNESFLLKGQNHDAAEKEGVLEILGPDMKTALLTLKLSHLGLIGLSMPPVEDEKIRRLRADLYCETMSVSAVPAKAGK